MSSLSKLYDVNQERRIHWGGPVFITVRFSGYKPFQDFMQRFYRGYEVMGGRKTRRVPDSERDAKLREGIAKFLIPAWEGVLDDEDNPIPCTEQNILAALNDPTVPDGANVKTNGERFFDDVLMAAGYEEDYRRSQQEEVEKNSEASSAST